MLKVIEYSNLCSVPPVPARRWSPVKSTAVINKPPISYTAAAKVAVPGRPPAKLNKEEPPKVRRTSPVKPIPKPGPAKKPEQRPLVKATIKEESKEVKKPVEIKKEVEKNKAEVVEVSPSSIETGRYELNELMTRMVEKELQDIMIKVWQVLPDNPPEEEDKLVVAKFRNEAGDHLRNVLGLNITQRLLNVHNPLYVKVQFSGKPEKADLREFLKKYNFNGFKRIQSAVNMFAAQVKTINDFDRLCTEKDIKCGNAKVTVVPIYKFSKCPPNLITSFNIADEDKDLQTKDNNIIHIDDNKTSKETSTHDNKEKPAIVKVEKPDDTKRTLENKPKVVNKVEAKPLVENKVEAKPIVENKVDKTTIKNQPNNKTTIKNQLNDKTTKDGKVVLKNKVENTPAPVTVNKTKPIETKVVKKLETKPVVPVKQVKPVETKPAIVKTPVKSTETKKVITKTSEAKQITPTKNKFIGTPISKPVAKKSKVENDFDELDDYDILALMSEGIVLDECEGSDED